MCLGYSEKFFRGITFGFAGFGIIKMMSVSHTPYNLTPGPRVAMPGCVPRCAYQRIRFRTYQVACANVGFEIKNLGMVSINHPPPFVGIAVLVRISFNNDFSFRPRLFLKKSPNKCAQIFGGFCTIPITQPVSQACGSPTRD